MTGLGRPTVIYPNGRIRPVHTLPFLDPALDIQRTPGEKAMRDVEAAWAARERESVNRAIQQIAHTEAVLQARRAEGLA